MDFFSRFVWAKGYKVANQKVIHDFQLNFHIFIFVFPLCFFLDNSSHFTEAEITAFFELYNIIQIYVPISYPSSISLAQRNMQLIISQVKKQLLDWELSAKTIWRHNISEINLLLNDQLIRLYGFTFLQIMFEYVLKWKVIGQETPIQEVISGRIEEYDEGEASLIIERMIDKKEE